MFVPEQIFRNIPNYISENFHANARTKFTASPPHLKNVKDRDRKFFKFCSPFFPNSRPSIFTAGKREKGLNKNIYNKGM
jgi:hypothetical protein